ncbi:MAG: phosphotransferase [Legionellales bacterium]|nr:phosphotransferase [Legionellales bacterium]
MNNSISAYKQHLNLQKATFSRIDHDDAMVAIVYHITQPTGEQFILKICPRTQDYLREAYFLKHFAGQLPVPRIIQLVEPEADVDGAILMECLQGKLLTENDVTDTLAYEIGVLLARIHLNRTSGYGDLTKPEDLNPAPRFHFTSKFEEGFAECSHHLPSTLLEQCHRYYDTNIDFLTNVDGSCIIHRDFRPGNIIVHKGKIEGIIDWASGRASFAEEDFCPLEHGEWPIHPSSKKSFLAGYASVRPLPDYRTIMPFLRMSRAFATIGFTVKCETWQTKNSRAYEFNRRFLEAFF